MRIDDASGEIKDRVLQAQQAHQSVPTRAIYLSRIYIPTEGGEDQTRPAIHKLLTGSQRYSFEANAKDGTGLETASADTGNAAGTSVAIQFHNTWVGELLWGILSDSNAQALSIH